MPPYFFRTGPEQAERILANSPEGSAKIYETFEAQAWIKGVMCDIGGQDLDAVYLDFFCNEVVDATLMGDRLMHVDADNRDVLQYLAKTAEVDIQPLN